MKNCLGLSYLLLSVTVLFVGCSDQVILNEDTKQEVQTVMVQEGLQTVEHQADNMDRGDHDFMTNYYGELVIDPNVNDYKRGDVIYYAVPEKYNEKRISRIVALSGEEIEIKDGQVYIDGKKLDTFYGSFHRKGMDMEQYLKWRKENKQDQGKNEEQVREEWLHDHTLEKVTIPENHIYVLGDDWLRSVDSRVFGPLLKDNIRGKVLGYKK